MDAERILELAANRASQTPSASNIPLPRDSDVDGRPSVGWRDHDPLLERLCRFHPEMIPPELMKQLATSQRREPILASALD